MQAKDARRIRLGDNEVVIHVCGEETRGAYSLIEYVAAPDGITPQPHRHDFAESFYVLSGVLGGEIEGQPFSAAAGTTLHVPGSLVHSWWNAGSAPVRMLIVCAPAGFENYLEDLAAAVAEQPPGPPQMETLRPIIARLWQKHGLQPSGGPGSK